MGTADAVGGDGASFGLCSHPKFLRPKGLCPFKLAKFPGKLSSVAQVRPLRVRDGSGAHGEAPALQRTCQTSLQNLIQLCLPACHALPGFDAINGVEMNGKIPFHCLQRGGALLAGSVEDATARVGEGGGRGRDGR